MADGNALHVARTKAFPAVGVRKHWQEDFPQICLPVIPGRLEKPLARRLTSTP